MTQPQPMMSVTARLCWVSVTSFIPNSLLSGRALRTLRKSPSYRGVVTVPPLLHSADSLTNAILARAKNDSNDGGRRNSRPRKGRREVSDDDLLDAFEPAFRIISKPIIFPWPLAYSLFLIVAAACVSPVTSVILGGSFVGFSIMGRSILSDDDGMEKASVEKSDQYALSDLLALGGAIVTAGLLSPLGFEVGGKGELFSALVGSVAIIIAGIAVTAVAPSSWLEGWNIKQEEDGAIEEQDLLDLWDDRLDILDVKNRDE